tara:strand:- start:180 stop:380 length:201 start_codon:yes stop_codon:yes gene_type:complete
MNKIDKRVEFTAQLITAVEGRDLESILTNLLDIKVLTKKDLITICDHYSEALGYLMNDCKNNEHGE